MQTSEIIERLEALKTYIWRRAYNDAYVRYAACN